MAANDLMLYYGSEEQNGEKMAKHSVQLLSNLGKTEAAVMRHFYSNKRE
jgi:hypothetical protein